MQWRNSQRPFNPNGSLLFELHRRQPTARSPTTRLLCMRHLLPPLSHQLLLLPTRTPQSELRTRANRWRQVDVDERCAAAVKQVKQRFLHIHLCAVEAQVLLQELRNGHLGRPPPLPINAAHTANVNSRPPRQSRQSSPSPQELACPPLHANVASRLPQTHQTPFKLQSHRNRAWNCSRKS